MGIKPTIKDEVIYSDGTTLLGGDDKAGIAAFIEAIAVIKEQNLSHGDIEVVFTILEESGLTGSKCLDLNGLKSKKVIVLDEGTVGWIIVQGPAQDTLDEIVKKPLEERGRWVRGMEGDFSFLARLTPNVFWG